MRRILVGLFFKQMDPTMISYENQSCIKLVENLVFHDQSKHINIRYHHLRDYMQRRIMLLEYIPTKECDVDILAKTLSRGKFKFNRGRIRVTDNPFPAKRKC